MKNELKKLSDIELIALAKQHDEDAQLTLFNKYYPFIWKSYCSHIDLYKKVNLDFEDFKADAMIILLESIEDFDEKIAKEKNVTSLFTVFYTRMLKLMNKSQNQIEKYGIIKYASEFDTDEGEDSTSSYDWNSVSQGDTDEDIRKDQMFQALRIYLERETNEFRKRVAYEMMKGTNVLQMTKVFDNKITYFNLKKVIDFISDSIYNIGIQEVGIA